MSFESCVLTMAATCNRVCTCSKNVHQCRERDGEEDRKPGGKTRVESVGLKEEDVLDGTV